MRVVDPVPLVSHSTSVIASVHQHELLLIVVLTLNLDTAILVLVSDIAACCNSAQNSQDLTVWSLSEET